MREAEKRLKELERRVPSTNIDDQKRMVAGMVYENLFSSTTKRYVLSKQQPGDDVPDIRGSFDQLKKAVEELKELEDKSKPVKMELSAVLEKDDYTAQEWIDYWESGGEEWPAEEWPEEPPPSLDALGRKGKGKGKSKGKDGKGEGKGKGKGKRKRRQRQRRWPCLRRDPKLSQLW